MTLPALPEEITNFLLNLRQHFVRFHIKSECKTSSCGCRIWNERHVIEWGKKNKKKKKTPLGLIISRRAGKANCRFSPIGWGVFKMQAGVCLNKLVWRKTRWPDALTELRLGSEKFSSKEAFFFFQWAETCDFLLPHQSSQHVSRVCGSFLPRLSYLLKNLKMFSSTRSRW